MEKKYCKKNIGKEILEKEIKKSKKDLENFQKNETIKYNDIIKNNDIYENNDLKNFFQDNFSDSKILQKNFSDKLKILFTWKKFFNFLFNIKNIFWENFLKNNNKIFFDEIWDKFLKFNLKDFDENLEFYKKNFLEILEKNNNFSELKIYLENKKEYLEIVNCDLIFDFWNKKIKKKITLQSDEFLKMVN